MKANNSSVIFLVLAALRYLEAAAAPAEQEQGVEAAQLEAAQVEDSLDVEKVLAAFELAGAPEEIEGLVAGPVVDESEFVTPISEDQESEFFIPSVDAGLNAEEAAVVEEAAFDEELAAEEEESVAAVEEAEQKPPKGQFSLAAFEGFEDASVHEFRPSDYQFDYRQAGQQAGVQFGTFSLKEDNQFDSPIFESEQQQQDQQEQFDAQQDQLKSLNLGHGNQHGLPLNLGGHHHGLPLNFDGHNIRHVVKQINTPGTPLNNINQAVKEINLPGLDLHRILHLIGKQENNLLAQLNFCELSTLATLGLLRAMGVFYPAKANAEERYRTAMYVQNIINNFPCERERNIMMQVANQYPPIYSSQKLYDAWVQNFGTNVLQEINSPLSKRILELYATLPLNQIGNNIQAGLNQIGNNAQLGLKQIGKNIQPVLNQIGNNIQAGLNHRMSHMPNINMSQMPSMSNMSNVHGMNPMNKKQHNH